MTVILSSTEFLEVLVFLITEPCIFQNMVS